MTCSRPVTGGKRMKTLGDVDIRVVDIEQL